MQQTDPLLGDLEPLRYDLLQILDRLVLVDGYVELAASRGGDADGDGRIGASLGGGAAAANSRPDAAVLMLLECRYHRLEAATPRRRGGAALRGRRARAPVLPHAVRLRVALAHSRFLFFLSLLLLLYPLLYTYILLSLSRFLRFSPRGHSPSLSCAELRRAATRVLLFMQIVPAVAADTAASCTTTTTAARPHACYPLAFVRAKEAESSGSTLTHTSSYVRMCAWIRGHAARQLFSHVARRRGLSCCMSVCI